MKNIRDQIKYTSNLKSRRDFLKLSALITLFQLTQNFFISKAQAIIPFAFFKKKPAVFKVVPGTAITPGSTNFGIAVFNQGGVIKTTDGGMTWSHVYGSVPQQSYGGISCGNAFLVPNDAGDRVFSDDLSAVNKSAGYSTQRVFRAPNTGTIIKISSGYTLIRSTDGGITFSTVCTPVNYRGFSSGLHYGNGVWFFSFVDTNPTPRTQNHYISTDDGLTWSNTATTGLPTTSAGSFSGFSCYMNGSHHAWLSPDGATGVKYYKSTNGTTWTYTGVLTGASIGDVYGSEFGTFYRSPYFYAQNSKCLARSTDGYTFTNWGVSIPSYTKYNGSPGYINGTWFMSGCDSTYKTEIYSTTDPTVGWTLRYTSIESGTYDATIIGINQNNPI